MRCLLLLLVSLLLGVAAVSSVHAEGSVSSTTGDGTYYTDSYTTVHYTSARQACDGGIAYLNSQGGVFNYNNGGNDTVVFYFMDNLTCVYVGVKWGAGSNFQVGTGTGTVTTCPANSTASSGSSCACAAGFVPSGSGCQPASSTCQGYAAGMGGTFYASGGGGGNVLCHANCEMNAGLSGTDGSGTYFSGPFSATGSACGGATGPAPAGLQPGQCPGTVNGVSVSVPCGSTTSTSSGGSTPGPTSSEPAAPGATNGTSTSSSTTCTGGNCTTTTTTTSTSGVGSPGGGTTTTGSGTTTQSEGSFCQLNPGDPQCGDKSSFGGSCGAPFVCTGDAVACATAQIEAQSYCSFNAGPSASTTASYAALKAQDGHTAVGTGDTAVAIDSVLPTAPPAVCAVQDLVIPIGAGAFATSLTLPIGTYICPHLLLIHTVVVSFGSLMFILIVFVRN